VIGGEKFESLKIERCIFVRGGAHASALDGSFAREAAVQFAAAAF
jgi:hypothetical protein